MTPIRLLLIGGVAVAGMRLGIAHADSPCDGVQPWRVHEITIRLSGERIERDYLLTCVVVDGQAVMRGGE